MCLSHSKNVDNTDAVGDVGQATTEQASLFLQFNLKRDRNV